MTSYQERERLFKALPFDEAAADSTNSIAMSAYGQAGNLLEIASVPLFPLIIGGWLRGGGTGAVQE